MCDGRLALSALRSTAIMLVFALLSTAAAAAANQQRVLPAVLLSILVIIHEHICHLRESRTAARPPRWQHSSSNRIAVRHGRWPSHAPLLSANGRAQYVMEARIDARAACRTGRRPQSIEQVHAERLFCKVVAREQSANDLQSCGSGK